MSKLFRKIRQKLLTENKFSKYLLYAIGEIVLVVLGIMIALQINGWNESKKDRIKEGILLNDLAKNIAINIQTFQNDIDLLQRWNHSSEIIMFTLQNKLGYSDTLRPHFHSARITKQNMVLSNVGYQAYKDQGLDIILNKNLSSEIIQLFEVIVPGTLSTNDLVNEIYPAWDNHIVQNFDFVHGQGLTPNDYESLFSDHYYISWIKAYSQGRRKLIATDEILIKECERVLSLLRDELVVKERS